MARKKEPHLTAAVENKYNLNIKDCKKLKVVDRTKVKSPLFWRDERIKAWYISKTAGTASDIKSATDNSFWMCIYDKGVKPHSDRFRFRFTSFGGMRGYDFDEFFQQEDIDNANDLKIQEMFLETINTLIDEGVLA